MQKMRKNMKNGSIYADNTIAVKEAYEIRKSAERIFTSSTYKNKWSILRRIGLN